MNLEQLLQDKIDTRVFIDTCSLMHPKFEKFLAKVVPVLSLYGYKLVVPWSCIEELNKHKTNPKLAKTEHSHPLGMVVSTHFRCGKGVKRGLKNGALPFTID